MDQAPRRGAAHKGEFQIERPARVKQVLEHYESQSEDEAMAEDEAAFEQPHQTFMEVPKDLVPAVRELIAEHRKAS